jgi:hypothetical protein
VEVPLSINDLIIHVERSIVLAWLGISNLSKDIFYLDGLSSPKIRALLNNLCDRKSTRYLEIGSWKGSTLISALYSNEQMVDLAIGIDCFREFTNLGSCANPLSLWEKTIDPRRPPQQEHPRECCRENINKLLKKPLNLYFYDNDCFSKEFLNIITQQHAFGDINVYLYDGDHSESCQYKGFTEYDFIFDSTFIALVDDWNWESAKIGTRRAFSDLGYRVIREWELPARFNGDVENWWNGFYVAIVQKTKDKG